MSESISPLDPLLIAYKIKAVRNFEHPEVTADIEKQPRYLELLWALQWFSQPENYPGGLRRFTEEFIQANVDKIGTPVMRALGKVEHYTWDQFLEISKEMPWRHSDEFVSMGLLTANQDEEYVEENADNVPTSAEFKRCTPSKVRADMASHAQGDLLRYFRSLCQSPASRFDRGQWHHPGNAPWYWQDVCQDLLDWLDVRTQDVANEIAQTRVTEDVFKWLRMAKECDLPVWLNGSSRFGKSESIRAFAKARPGLFRVVETPEDNSVLSLCKAIAKALGIECTRSSALKLRGLIQEVLEASRIMLILDEAHFIFGSSFSRNTRPQRLDMVRRLIIDAGLPLAFISTPQSYDQARRKFERATSYTFEQLDGRLLTQQPINLPEEISHEEVLAVAAIHLPGLSSEYHEVVARKAQAVKGSVFSYVKSVAKVAQVYARDDRRTKPKLADIQRAVADILPTPAEQAPTLQKPAPARRASISSKEVFGSRAGASRETSVTPPSRITTLTHPSEQKETGAQTDFAAAAA